MKDAPILQLPLLKEMPFGKLGLPVPGFSAALTYYDGYRRGRLPANLLQAQRDYFGAHTYERTDKPRGEKFHTDWIRERKLT